MPLGQASGMAFPGVVSCWKSCYLSLNGDAEIAWLKRKKVYWKHSQRLIFSYHIVSIAFASLWMFCEV